MEARRAILSIESICPGSTSLDNRCHQMTGPSQLALEFYDLLPDESSERTDFPSQAFQNARGILLVWPVAIVDLLGRLLCRCWVVGGSMHEAHLHRKRKYGRGQWLESTNQGWRTMLLEGDLGGFNSFSRMTLTKLRSSMQLRKPRNAVTLRR